METRVLHAAEKTDQKKLKPFKNGREQSANSQHEHIGGHGATLRGPGGWCGIEIGGTLAGRTVDITL